MTDLLVLADDLSGAAESAAALRVRGSRRYGPVHVALWPAPVPPGDVVIDLHSRHLPAADVEHRLTDVLHHHRSRTVVTKVDSLLRGNLVPVVRAARKTVLLAPALPVAGRTVRDGRLLVEGRPLATTAAWAIEDRPAPDTVADALPGVPTTTLPLDLVRSKDLATHLVRIDDGTVVICDAETDDDLDRLVTAASGCALVGSAALVAAVARALPAGTPEEPELPRDARSVVVVVGTAEPVAQQQLRELERAGAPVVDLPCTDVLDGTAATHLTNAARNPLTVVRLTGRAEGRSLSRALGRVVADAVGPADLVLTGGETARQVLDALGVPSLRVVGQIEHGAVRSETPDGRHVVTRPGSFGAPDSLLTIVRALNPDLLRGTP
ncbi:four-carbon acid sugar kinase family protein [Kineococcus aurantiacus]|uniref:4-hydroxythreonine-4-phosphate dehydrogenase n=1 Tax=Kineococcus aurantiacus TaxID=37633 RepID=A0A7Y9J180_9ACTN|nr:4-hydroxythreonine-4-phosphate dehydrogenase [Kineococcus aurantiacus]